MSTKKYNIEDYEDLFVIESADLEDTNEERIERLRDKKIGGYRVKTIRSGDMLEIEAYPTPATPGKRGKKKKKGTRKAQVKLNDKNTQKYLTRLLNENFTKKDIWLTLTYQNDRLPADVAAAKKDMTNYIRRLKHYCTKHNLPELKYVYVTEYRDESKKRKKRVHHHIVCNFEDRDVAEELWAGGGRTQARRLQPDVDFGLEGLARYIGKDVKSSKNDEGETVKRYTPSRNLKEPKVTVADSKLSKRRAEKLALDENIAHEVFEKLYKGYGFKDIQVRFSPYVSGAYIYVRMRRIEPKENKSSRRTRQDE